MKKCLLIMCLMLTAAHADEFSDLKKKKDDVVAKNPFANNKAKCSSTTSTGVKLSESWWFFKTEDDVYLRDLGGIIQKGTYQIDNDLLKLKQTSSKIGLKETPVAVESELKFKIAPKGFDYIFTNKNGEKFLYECLWTGSLMSKF